LWRKFLIDPGADIVICDEGHQLKSDKSQILLALQVNPYIKNSNKIGKKEKRKGKDSYSLFFTGH
jgi:hypothetical protein